MPLETETDAFVDRPESPVGLKQAMVKQDPPVTSTRVEAPVSRSTARRPQLDAISDFYDD